MGVDNPVRFSERRYRYWIIGVFLVCNRGKHGRANITLCFSRGKILGTLF